MYIYTLFFYSNTPTVIYRATNEFQIEVSNDLITWTVVVDSQLASVRGLGCNVPMVSFAPTSLEQGKYIKFVMKTYHGPRAGGLMYLGFDTEPV